MQLIFVVETNSQCQSDKKYITAAIMRFYEDNAEKRSFVFMNGKTNYNHVENQIYTYKKKYGLNNVSHVIYCIDVDNFADADKQTANISTNKKIIQYCNKNNYDLVQFYVDVEDVFIGKQISDKLKKQCSDTFYKKQSIKNINCKDLSVPIVKDKRHKSNLLLVLDQYLTRKEL